MILKALVKISMNNLKLRNRIRELKREIALMKKDNRESYEEAEARRLMDLL